MTKPRQGARGERGPISLPVVVARKQPSLPRYVVLPAARLERWRLSRTVVVETVLNGSAVGRRTLKRWDERTWFVELPERICRQVGIEVGDRATLIISLASTDMPTELAELLQRDASARHAWAGLSESRRRALQEEVRAPVRPETRLRRARCGLGVTTP